MPEPQTEAQQVRLTAPPGYGAVAPFDKTRHAGLGLKPGRDFAWARKLNAVYVSAVEFTRAALEYPIAFVREKGKDGGFIPVAVLGLGREQNLLVDADGAWRKGSYVPAYFRRHPFCLADVPTAEEPGRQLVCVQEDQLAPGDKPLLDAQGAPTAEWEPILKLLEAVEGARNPTLAFARHLDSLGLLVPFEAVAVPKGGAQTRLAGLHRVDEEKLRKLNARALRTLLMRGELRLVYAHLLSLENFAKLLDLNQAQANTRGP